MDYFIFNASEHESMIEKKYESLPEKSFKDGVLEMDYFLRWYEIIIECNHSVTTKID